MAIKTFTAGSVLTASDTNTYLANSGLVYITQKSWTSGATVSVDNCFTSTYSNYRIVIRNASHATTAVQLLMRMRASGTDTAGSAYYWACRYINWAATGGDASGNGVAQFFPGCVASNTNPGSATIDVYQPQKAAVTSISYQGLWAATNGESYSGNGVLNNTTSYDGFSLIANTGNLSALTVYVYGYRES